MTWRSEALPPVPETTAAMVKAAFPNGTLDVDRHTECGFLYDTAAFADLYSQHRGRPVEVAPWRLALVTVMPSMAGLTDRQAADAVRRCLDWQYALRLDLSAPGFNFTVLHDFRERFVYHEGSHQLLDTLLEVCKARGWIKVRGKQRTDSTHVLAAIRTLHRLELALDTLRAALNQRSAADPQWVRGWAPLAWYERYGPRAESLRLPQERSTRERLAVLMGLDGYALMGAVYGSDETRHLRHRPDFAALRRIGLQQSSRGREPGREEVRWRQNDEEPPSALRIQSPSDLEARSGTKRDTEWVGYQTHLSETCDEGDPALITPVLTTLSTTPDDVMGPPIQHELAGRELLPGQQLLDAGDVDAELLVTAQSRPPIAVVGLLSSNSGWHSRAATGYGLEAFE